MFFNMLRILFVSLNFHANLRCTQKPNYHYIANKYVKLAFSWIPEKAALSYLFHNFQIVSLKCTGNMQQSTVPVWQLRVLYCTIYC